MFRYNIIPGARSSQLPVLVISGKTQVLVSLNYVSVQHHARCPCISITILGDIRQDSGTRESQLCFSSTRVSITFLGDFAKDSGFRKLGLGFLACAQRLVTQLAVFRYVNRGI